MSKKSCTAGGALECWIFLFRLNTPGARFDCTPEPRRLQLQYPRWGDLSNYAHLPGIISSILDYGDIKMGLMKSAGSFATEAIGLRLS